MTVQTFLILLSAFSLAVGLTVQAVKKLLDSLGKNYSSNIVAVTVSAIIGTGGTAVYYIISGIPFNTVNVICMILMGLATAVGAMVGYDKVIQTVKQIVEKGGK